MDEDYEHEISFTLEPTGGVVKSIGDVRVAGLSRADMDINVYCIYELHGYLDGEGTKPASLLVFRFDLSSGAAGRRFKGFRPMLTLRKEPPGEPEDDPWVEDLLEPGGRGLVYIRETFTKKTRTSSFSPTITLSAPPPVPVSASIGYTRQETEEYIAIDRYTVRGGRRSDQSQGARETVDKVYWNANQDPKIKSGIDVLQVAFIVGRQKAKSGKSKEEDFKVTFELDADVDLKYKTTDKLANKFKKFKGAKAKKSHVFRPSGGDSSKIPPGVEKNYLRKLESGEGRKIFDGLAWVHDIELQKPIQLYEGDAHGNATQVVEEEEEEEDVFEDAQTTIQN